MKIIIADDHALLRRGIQLQLKDFSDGADIAEADSFSSLFTVAASFQPDLAIVDLGMPGMTWRDALTLFRERFPDALLVVLSANDDDKFVQEAIRLGANGFISKSDPPEVMMAALNLVKCGGTCVPLNYIKRSGGPVSHAALPSDAPITSRQREVLALIAEGLSNKQIAYRLHLTEGTVKLHVAAILKGLGATNRTQAVAAARNAGLLALHSSSS